MIEIIPSIAAQSASVVQNANTLNIPNHFTAIGLAIVVALVIFGGITRIVKVTEKLVPFMAGIYLAIALVIVAMNIAELPGVIGLIFKTAFTGHAAVGGFGGAMIAAAIRNGVARGTYSNEAGMGTAPIAHAAAVTDHPVRQAFWGIFEIVIDTIIVCSTTAFVVLTTGVWKTIGESDAASMPAAAFQTLLGENLGGTIVTISIAMFVISTIVVIAFYGEKQAEYLFGSAAGLIIKFVYLAAIIFGAYGGLTFIIKFLDITLAALILPNLVGLFLMSGEVAKLKDEFFSNPKFYPNAK